METRTGWMTLPTRTAGEKYQTCLLLKSLASGSSTLIAITFQSVSPSSIMARTPSTFTLITSPREHTWREIQSEVQFRAVDILFLLKQTVALIIMVNELAKRKETAKPPAAVIPCCRFHRHRRGRCHHSNQCLHLCVQDLPTSEIHKKKWSTADEWVEPLCSYSTLRRCNSNRCKPEEWLRSSKCSLYAGKCLPRTSTCPSSHLA